MASPVDLWLTLNLDLETFNVVLDSSPNVPSNLQQNTWQDAEEYLLNE